MLIKDPSIHVLRVLVKSLICVQVEKTITVSRRICLFRLGGDYKVKREQKIDALYFSYLEIHVNVTIKNRSIDYASCE